MVLRSSIIAGICCLIVFPIVSKAQNNSSPYSIIGIGNVENSYFNRYTGMGNAGVALSDGRYINNSNAASLSKLGNHIFSFELSTRASVSAYTGGNLLAITPNSTAPNTTFDVTFRRISVATKLTNKWGSSLGLQPYSTANYSYTAIKSIEGNNQIDTLTAQYEGSGGVNQFYWANGYQLTKNTSVGVTSSVLFGSLKQTESFLNAEVPGGLVTTDNIYLSGAYFNFSLLTKLRLSHSWVSTYGVTFSPKTTFHTTYNVTVTDASLDTLKKDQPLDDHFTIPAVVNLGMAFIKNDKYTFTVNAQEQSWSEIRGNAFQPVGGADYQLVNSSKISIGYQKSNKVKNFYGQEYEKSFFQLGAYGGNTYLRVSGQQLTDYGGSIGYGRNGKRSPIGYYIAIEAGRRGSSNTNVLSENYFNLNLVLSYIDRWYKGKKYY